MIILAPDKALNENPAVHALKRRFAVTLPDITIAYFPCTSRLSEGQAMAIDASLFNKYVGEEFSIKKNPKSSLILAYYQSKLVGALLFNPSTSRLTSIASALKEKHIGSSLYMLFCAQNYNRLITLESNQFAIGFYRKMGAETIYKYELQHRINRLNFNRLLQRFDKKLKLVDMPYIERDCHTVTFERANNADPLLFTRQSFTTKTTPQKPSLLSIAIKQSMSQANGQLDDGGNPLSMQPN